jgi:hypothetical protein
VSALARNRYAATVEVVAQLATAPGIDAASLRVRLPSHGQSEAGAPGIVAVLGNLTFVAWVVGDRQISQREHLTSGQVRRRSAEKSVGIAN